MPPQRHRRHHPAQVRRPAHPQPVQVVPPLERRHQPSRHEVPQPPVHRLQQGQPPQTGLHPPTGGRPGRMLVPAAARILILHPPVGHEGRVDQPLQVGLALVVRSEALPQLRPSGPVPTGQRRGPHRLPGRRMLVVAGVEQIHRAADQKPPLRHPPPHRRHPAAPPQRVQHPPDVPLRSSHDGRQVARARQGHQPRDPEQTPLLLADESPGRHIGTSTGLCGQTVMVVPPPSRRECPAGPASGGGGGSAAAYRAACLIEWLALSSETCPWIAPPCGSGRWRPAKLWLRRRTGIIRRIVGVIRRRYLLIRPASPPGSSRAGCHRPGYIWTQPSPGSIRQ